MKRHLRFFTTLFLVLLFISLGYINWRLYYSPAVQRVDGVTINEDALCQLRHLRDALENDAAYKMQHLYPEGYVFYNALYGLSWCDLAASLPFDGALYREAHEEIQQAFYNINSDEGRLIFDDALPLPYGAFYNGWLTYLLGKKLSVEPPGRRDAKEVEFFKAQCAKIAAALRRQVYPESYYGSAWPADVVVCVAALALHDKLYADTYRARISTWWQRVHQNLDPLGLIPHSANPRTGKPLEPARGSSQSLIQSFLPEIIAADHGFDSYRNAFSDNRFGLHGIREYPAGKHGAGDIDSGPVVFGMGGAATIVGMRAMQAHHLSTEYTALRNCVEALAFPVNIQGRKKYLLGKLPIADVFITWAPGAVPVNNTDKDQGWRTRFQIVSVVTGILIVVSLILMWRKA